MDNWRNDISRAAEALGVGTDEYDNWRLDVHNISEALINGGGGGGGGGGMTPAQVQALINSSLASYTAQTANIADAAVTTAKLADGAVAAAKLGTNSVTTTKIADNAVTSAKLANGAVTQAKILTDIRPTIYVDFQYTGTTSNGAFFTPFKTLQAAVDASTFGDVIVLGPGASTEDIVINTDNLTIVADGSDGQYRTEIIGNLTINSSAERIGLSNLYFTGEFTLNTAAGLVYAEKCDFGSITYPSTYAGYSRMLHCFFEHGASVDTGSDGLVDFQFCQWENGSTLSINSGACIVYGCRQVILEHTAGTVYVYGDTQFIGDSNGRAINSTAANTTGNALMMLGGTTLTAAGSFAAINKTGGCVFGFGNFLHNPENDTLNGIRADIGIDATDVVTRYSPVNYTASSEALQSHLAGIDTAIQLPLVATVCPATTVIFAFSEDGSTFSFTGGTFLWMSSKGKYGTTVFGAQINIPYITGRVIILDVSNPASPQVSTRSVSNISFSENEYVIGNMFNAGTNPTVRTVTVYGSGAYTWSAIAGHHEAYGDISSTGAQLDLVIGDFTVRAAYSTPTAAAVSILATNTTLTNIDIRRWSIYGGTSEGSSFDDYTLTTSGVVVDDTVLLDSSDTCIIWIGNGRQVIEVKVFISAGGTRCRILSDYLTE